MARKTTEKKKSSNPRRALKKPTARAGMGKLKRDKKADERLDAKLKKLNEKLAKTVKKLEKIKIKKHK